MGKHIPIHQIHCPFPNVCGHRFYITPTKHPTPSLLLWASLSSYELDALNTLFVFGLCWILCLCLQVCTTNASSSYNGCNFKLRSKLLQLLAMAMHPLSPLSQHSHLSSTSFWSFSSLALANNGITSNFFLSFLFLIFCTYNDGVASFFFSLSIFSSLLSLSSLTPIIGDGN